jgi:ubiquinone/menaquinone biosynthesis C-methylase UbiE
MREHFRRIAPSYRDLRTTDLKPIAQIAHYLLALPIITLADIGCGAGRYTLELLRFLANRVRHIDCVDSSAAMLQQLGEHLTQQGIKGFSTLKASAMALPIPSLSLTGVLTFNALHHFKLPLFLRETARVLQHGGYLFMYTRTRSQNARNIWGRLFPLFKEKETRLYELPELEAALGGVPQLQLQAVHSYQYERASTIERLVAQARARHYSTFSLYGPREFERALQTFQINLRRHFPDLQNIRWWDENLMLIARKGVS